jgi:copper(I)-binding protein
VILHGRSLTVLRRAIIVAVAAIVPALAGCEAGTNAPVEQWHQPTAGASAVLPSGHSGQLAIRNVFVLGAPPDTSLAAGSSAGLFLALVNTGPADRLISVSAPGTASSVTLPPGGVTVRRNQAVLLQGPVPQVILTSISRSLGGGEAIQVILNFQNAGSVTLSVPVMPKAQYYETYSAAPVIPTATPTKPKATSGSATATPSATPSPSAS